MAHCNVTRIDELIEQAVTQLLLKEPFFAHLIVHLSREVSNRTETIALEKTNESYSVAKIAGIQMIQSFKVSSGGGPGKRRKRKQKQYQNHPTYNINYKHCN